MQARSLAFWLVSLGCSPPLADTPLAAAAARGDVTAVRRLLSAGARPAERTSFGLPPLTIAARSGHAEVVRALLAAGADPDQLDEPPTRERWTPLMNAAHTGQVEIVEILLAAGANARYRTPGGNTAARLADEDAIRRLVEP